MASKKLVFVTGNRNKLKEVKAILSQGLPIEIESQNFDIPEIQGTTQEVATEKCKAAAKLVGGPCITEDTALCYNALNGLPGPFVKYFLRDLGLEGLNTLIAGFPDKSAYTLCTFAYSSGPGADPILFEGRGDGRIVPPRGKQDFGWNPVFEAQETGQTYAEMSDEEKNAISHRYRALQKLRTFLESQTKKET